MTSSYTSNLRFVQQGDGDNSNTWGDVVNAGFTALSDQAIAGVTSIVMTDTNYTMSYTNGASDEARSAMLIVTSSVSLTATRAVIAPLGVSKLYVVYNNTSGGQSITIGMSTGAVTTIPNGKRMLVYIDGTNCYEAVEYINTASLGSLSLSGALTGTTGSFSGNVGTTAGAVTISGAAGTGRGLVYETAAVNRWDIFANSTAESGSNVGSDLVIARYSDAGSLIDTPIVITRSTGLVTLADALTVTGAITGALTGNASTATALATGGTISITGDISYTSPTFTGSNVTAAGTLATVNSNVGSFGSGSSIPNFTVNAKGLITAAGATALSNATTSTTGVVELATGAQVLTGTNTTNAVTPASLTSQQSIATNGYVTLPGGLILQWGHFNSGSWNGSTQAITFPIAFPTACLNISGTSDNAGISGGKYACDVVLGPTTTGASFAAPGYFSGGSSNSNGFYWHAIGY